MKLRLGMACGVASPTQTCACCGVRVDPKGWHHLYIKGSHLIARNDRLVATLAAMLRDAAGRGRVHVELLGCLTEGSGTSLFDCIAWVLEIVKIAWVTKIGCIARVPWVAHISSNLCNLCNLSKSQRWPAMS